MLVIIGIFLTIFFGFLFSLLIIPKIAVMERIGLSFVLGIGLQTFLMFLSTLVGLKTDMLNTLGLLILLSLLLLFFVKKSVVIFMRDLKKTFVFPRFTLLEKIILGSLVFLLGYSFLVGIYWPVNDWDSLVLYDFRAKIFAETGDILTPSRSLSYFLGYPFSTSLAQAWVYMLGGKYAVFLYSLLFISFIFMFYGEIRKHSSRTVSLIFLLLLATTPILFEHSMMAYTNLPYTVYLVMGTIYLYQWMLNQGKGYLLLAGLMLGLSTWARSAEPFWLVSLGFVLLFSLWKRNILAPLIYGVIFFLLQQPWRTFSTKVVGEDYSTVTEISGKVTNLIVSFNLAKFLNVSQFMYTYVVKSWEPVSWLLVIAILMEAPKILRSRQTLFLLMVIGYLLALAFGAYIISFSFLEWQDIPGSATRLAMFFPPLFIYYLSSLDIFTFRQK